MEVVRADSERRAQFRHSWHPGTIYVSQADYNSGRGFAFGTYFDMGAEMDFAIFYASLRVMLGFDINVTEDNNRICAETGLAPGINNWYATGQMYAGLLGEMGVKVDLWFIKGKFPFIQS